MHHLDLYRLSGPSDLGRLNLVETFTSGICLVEWAERLEELTPAAHLAVCLTVVPEVPAFLTLIRAYPYSISKLLKLFTYYS